jgi:hypothetical protein
MARRRSQPEMTKLKYTGGALVIAWLAYVALGALQDKRDEDRHAADIRVRTLAALAARKDAERWSRVYVAIGCAFMFAALLALSTSGGWAAVACVGAGVVCFGTSIGYVLPYSLRGLDATSTAMVFAGGAAAFGGVVGVAIGLFR